MTDEKIEFFHLDKMKEIADAHGATIIYTPTYRRSGVDNDIRSNVRNGKSVAVFDRNQKTSEFKNGAYWLGPNAADDLSRGFDVLVLINPEPDDADNVMRKIGNMCGSKKIYIHG